MSINNFLNLNNGTTDILLKIVKDYQKVLDENKILKNKIENSTKSKKGNSKPTPKFYLTPKTSKLIVKCIKTLQQTDPISGWFVYLLLISGCRGTELQKVKMQDITPLLSKTEETFYNIKVNVAKKRTVTCIREIVIKNLRLFKKHTKIISKKKILIQGEHIFFKKLNISLRTIKLILSIFLKNSKIFLKSMVFVQINHFIYVEIYSFQI